MREIYNTKRAKSEHAAVYGIEPKNSAGCGICLNFLAGYGIRTPHRGPSYIKFMLATNFIFMDLDIQEIFWRIKQSYLF